MDNSFLQGLIDAKKREEEERNLPPIPYSLDQETSDSVVEDQKPTQLQNVSVDKFKELLAASRPESDPVVEPTEQVTEVSEDSSEDAVDPRLVEARKKRDDMQFYGNLLSGFQDLLKGATGANVSYRTADALKSQGKQAVDDYNADMKAQQEKELGKFKIGKLELEFTDMQRVSDPKSNESKFAQDMFIKHMASNGKPLSAEQEANIRNQSAKTLHANSKYLQNTLADMMKLRSIQAREERNKIMREKEEGVGKRFEKSQGLREEKFEHQVSEKDELSDKQTETLAGYDEALSLLDDASKFKADVDTGFITNLSDQARTLVGKQDPKVSDLKMTVGEALVQKVKALSGTAVSDQERALISQISLPPDRDWETLGSC